MDLNNFNFKNLKVTTLNFPDNVKIHFDNLYSTFTNNENPDINVYNNVITVMPVKVNDYPNITNKNDYTQRYDHVTPALARYDYEDYPAIGLKHKRGWPIYVPEPNTNVDLKTFKKSLEIQYGHIFSAFCNIQKHNENKLILRLPLLGLGKVTHPFFLKKSTNEIVILPNKNIAYLIDNLISDAIKNLDKSCINILSNTHIQFALGNKYTNLMNVIDERKRINDKRKMINDKNIFIPQIQPVQEPKKEIVTQLQPNKPFIPHQIPNKPKTPLVTRFLESDWGDENMDKDFEYIKKTPSQQIQQQPFQQQQPIQQQLPIQQPIQQPIQKSIQQPTQQPTQQPIQKPIQQPIQKPIQQPQCDTKMIKNYGGVYEYIGELKTYNYKFKDCVLTYTDRTDKPYTSQLILKKIELPTNYKTIINSQQTPKIPISIINSAIDLEIEKPENNNAFFVLPSQLNGAEYPDYNSIVTKISAYKSDKTGGPRGQLAVHPAVGQFILDNAYNDKNTTGINCVNELIVDTNITLKNGYLAVPQKNNESNKILDNLNKLMIVGMNNVLVDGYYYGRKGKEGPNTKTHFVNMIYASAIPINNYTNPYENGNLVNIANYIMIGQYYGALQTAYNKYENERIKIFLMPLGGGVFQNKPADIFKNIVTAINLLESKYADVPKKLAIHILTWKDSQPMESKTYETLRNIQQPIPSFNINASTFVPGQKNIQQQKS